MKKGTMKINLAVLLTASMTIGTAMPILADEDVLTASLSENAVETQENAEAADEALVAKSEQVNMHRLYNPNSGEHFYTADTRERDYLETVGWTYEGIGWRAPKSSKVPVYRLYNPNAGDHHYTTSAGERNHLTSVGWNDEGIGWYSAASKGNIPVYREYNPNAVTGTHNFTTSYSEHKYLSKIGWHDEGTAWYAVGMGIGLEQMSEGATVRELKLGTNRLDANLDGKEDSIKLALAKDNSRISVNYNGNTKSEETWYVYETKFYLVNVYDRTFLYMVCLADSDDPFYVSWNLTSGKPVKIEYVEDDAWETDFESIHNLVTNKGIDMIRTQTAKRSYHIGITGKLIPNTKWYSLETNDPDYDNTITAKREIRAEIVNDSPLSSVPESGRETTVAKGTKLTFYRTDGIQRVDAKAADGTVYRFTMDASVDDEAYPGNTSIDGIVSERLFEGAYHAG